MSEPVKMLMNQFAENVNDTWLRCMELKKLVRVKSTILYRSSRKGNRAFHGTRRKVVSSHRKREVPVFAMASSTEIAEFMKEMKEELPTLRSEIRSIKEKKDVEKRDVGAMACTR